MSQQQPQLYASLTAALGPEEQQVIKGAVENADRIAAEQQQARATVQGAASSLPSPGPPGVGAGVGHTQTNGTN